MSTRRQPGSYHTPPLDQAVVADAMHPGVFMCHPDASLIEIARMMATHQIHCVVVAGESSGPDLVWGMISDRDLVTAGLQDGPQRTAATMVHGPVLSIEPGMALREAAELMCEHDVSHVLVAEPERRQPVGILATLDVARVLAWGEV